MQVVVETCMWQCLVGVVCHLALASMYKYLMQDFNVVHILVARLQMTSYSAGFTCVSCASC
jgi:hypothetical protein